MDIIAYDIQNLTDARYFAAYGVSHMALSIGDDKSQISLKDAKEIMEWVAGPEPLLIYEGLEIEKSLLEEIKNLGIQSCILGEWTEAKPFRDAGFQIYRRTNKLYEESNEKIIWKCDGAEEINKSKYDDLSFVYVDYDIETSDLQILIDKNVGGIILRGGEEEKVGFKSYEDLDDIFEALEERGMLDMFE